MIESLPRLWFESLSNEEKECVSVIHKNVILLKAFRVCQDLQAYEPNTKSGKKRWSDFPKGIFALSGRELGLRIGTDKTTGQRLLERMRKCGIINIFKHGSSNKDYKDDDGLVKVKRGKAHVWKWLI
jgi:hypothetical protein